MLRTIIIDDDPNCIELLSIMLSRYCPQVQVLQTFTNPKEAPEAILEQSPDLLFLDIEMPGMTGFDLLDKIKSIRRTDVIFTTAHDEYAFKAFKYAAIDYLRKPVDAFELKDAVERCILRTQTAHAVNRIGVLMDNHHKISASPTLTLATQEGYIFVKVEDIMRCEADGAYTKIYLVNGEMVIVSHTMRHYEDILDDNHFFRIHDKHIVNLRFVKKYIKEDGQVLLTNGVRVDVSRRRKDAFLVRMSDL